MWKVFMYGGVALLFTLFLGMLKAGILTNVISGQKDPLILMYAFYFGGGALWLSGYFKGLEESSKARSAR